MNRQEFIRELRISMSGHFSVAEIQENVDYYEDYIDMQLRKGKTEAQVLDELGDPRLLIKSMKAAGKGNGSSGLSDSSTYHEMRGARNARQGNYGEGMKVHGKIVQVPCIIWILAFSLICILAIALMGAVLSLVLRIVMYLLPIIVIAGGLYWLYRNFIKK